MNRLHIAFADNGGLAKVPLIVPEGQGGAPWVPETVQAAARVLWERWLDENDDSLQPALEAANRDFAHSGGVSVGQRVEMAFLAGIAALAQEDTE
jgi:hypothetical protein